MRTYLLLALGLLACRDASSSRITNETTTSTASTASAPTPIASTASDGACLNPCGPAPKTICCGARDKCCAEGVAAHLYCYDGPGDCPVRP